MNTNQTTSAGKWSIGLGVAAIAFVLLFYLMVDMAKHGSGEQLGGLLYLALLADVGSIVLAFTSLLGAILGIVAIYKTKCNRGGIGLLLNLIVLVKICLAWMDFYHQSA